MQTLLCCDHVSILMLSWRVTELLAWLWTVLVAAPLQRACVSASQHQCCSEVKGFVC